MVKLDLEINEIIGLAELGKIDEKKLKTFLKVATKDELENYIVNTSLGNENVDEPPEEEKEPEEEPEL
jgi:hypothetical protein